MLKLTKSQAKDIVKALGMRATWSSEFQEWKLTDPTGGTYFTSDTDDMIGTAIAIYERSR